ncbi:N-acetylglucosamine-6-phosphate deacetylase [Edaphobacter acidisoli]|uniref:N-acetylglucosamine-6-phosphate deacetylase n=1 Tax=Edaphobacter acidisoli TaxID=2040573 RepID=A0A916RPJ4_9BACT|nr:N-acetylglucosamine-6-phosphate deacetylase [Edaphobacter acidisoli]GGA63855.1 N-acetylglucosamine-6-phosphate deacetylase [Edaphobacter acidisoli]
MPHTITARRLLTPEGHIDHPVITIEDGLIQSIDRAESSKEDTTLAPAFLDVHTHGAANHDVMEGTAEAIGIISRFLATRGVGRYLATTVTAPIDTTLRSLEGIANAIESPAADAAVPIGIHLEGPFISHAKRGVHPPADILPPDIALFDRFQQAARGHIRLMTVAPEVPGALDLIRHATGQGVKISIGHTNSTASEAQAGVTAGAASATHTYNAMRALDHRDPGVIATVLDDDNLFAELICDGVHVAPEMVRLWLKAKGAGRAVLVTDSMSATGMPDGIYTLGTMQVQVADGRAFAAGDANHGKFTLAGSVLTMDRAVENIQQFAGATLATAVNLASHNPAALLGLESSFAPGQPANFNVFNADGKLQSTILNGKQIN